MQASKQHGAQWSEMVRIDTVLLVQQDRDDLLGPFARAAGVTFVLGAWQEIISVSCVWECV